MKLSFWRLAFSVAVHAHDAFPRLVPPLVVQWAEDKFYDAGMRQTLRRATTEYRAATATVPVQAESWSCLAGDLDGHDAGAVDESDLLRDLHDNFELWPSSRAGVRA